MTLNPPTILDGRGPRPGAVTVATALAAVAGALTFGLSVMLVVALFDYASLSDPRTIITQLAGNIQLTGSFLLVVGAIQLANGLDRRTVAIGAGMLLLVFPGHLYYVEMELRRDSSEGDLWKVALPFAIGFAVTVATILFLALSRSTAEYLRATKHNDDEVT
jgi:hypothetical protein